MLKIEVISDTVCPWCYIGKRRLETALAERQTTPVSISWRPFRLHPNISPRGLEQQKYLASKYGNSDRAAQILKNLVDVGRVDGIDFRFELINQQPNTLDSHRLVKWAAQENKDHAIIETLFRYHFLRGLDIGDRTILVQAAKSVGLDENDIKARFDSDLDASYVTQSEKTARNSGVSGVPCFVFNDSYAVAGAQAPSVLLQIMDLAIQENLMDPDGTSFPNLSMGQDTP